MDMMEQMTIIMYAFETLATKVGSLKWLLPLLSRHKESQLMEHNLLGREVEKNWERREEDIPFKIEAKIDLPYQMEQSICAWKRRENYKVIWSIVSL